MIWVCLEALQAEAAAQELRLRIKLSYIPAVRRGGHKPLQPLPRSSKDATLEQ